jgi:hypothetical protein
MRTASRWMSVEDCTAVEGYHICVKQNSKKVAYKVEYDKHNNIMFVIASSWSSLRTVLRREFGWR